MPRSWAKSCALRDFHKLSSLAQCRIWLHTWWARQGRVCTSCKQRVPRGGGHAVPAAHARGSLHPETTGCEKGPHRAGRPESLCLPARSMEWREISEASKWPVKKTSITIDRILRTALDFEAAAISPWYARHARIPRVVVGKKPLFSTARRPNANNTSHRWR